MSEFKQIQTRIWQDNWFLSLKPEEKLLWIFLLTNEYSHISGLYEAPKPLISPLTGIKEWEKILLKFVKDGKIKYCEGWVYIVNKIKHQPISSNVLDNVNISIKKHFEKNKVILDKMLSPLQAPCKPLPEIEIEIEREIETVTNVTEAKPKEEKEVYGNTEINNLLQEFQDIMGFKSAGTKDRFMAKHLLNGFTKEQITAMLTYCAQDVYAPRIGSIEKLWFKRGDIIAGIRAKANKSPTNLDNLN